MTHRPKGPRPNRKGKEWTPAEVKRLRKLSKTTPTPLIADTLGRTDQAIYNKASDKGISLDPPNRSPYNRQKRK